MKKLLSITVIFVALIITSCASDKKDDPLAPTSTSDVRDKFVSYWSAIENSAVIGTPTSHTVNIIKSTTTSSEILINNFSGLSVSARAIVNSNLITIPYQQVGSIGFTQGTGTLTNANTISLTYTTTISGSRDSSSTVYSK